jgi:hypothetical protein
VRADGGNDRLGVAAGGDDGVAGSQSGLGDVDAQAAAGTGDEPDLLVTYAYGTPSVDLRTLLGTDDPRCIATEPRVGCGWEALMMGLLTGTPYGRGTLAAW